MWTNINNLFKSAGAFLSSSKAPPGTSIELYKAMRNENHFASKKFFIAFTSFISLMLFYIISVAVLFFLPKGNELIAGYVQIFSKTIEVFAIIIAAYLGVQTVADFRFASSSNTNLDSVLTSEQHEEKIIQEQTVVYAEKYKNDPSYAPIDWVFNQERE
jgi:hypothetical protein